MDTNATWIRAADESAGLTLRYQLRSLMTYASVREVHTTFMDLLREDYNYLHGVFGQPPAPGTQPEAPAPAPVRRQTPPPAPAPKPQTPEVDPSTGLPPRLRPDQKIKVMKHTIDVLEEIQKSEPEPPVLPKQESKAKLTVVEWTDPGLQALATTTVVPQLFPQHKPSANEPAALISEREKKAILAKQQKEAEEATYARLVSEGIDPNGLLTKENLTEWITKKEMTFTQVAREKVGLPDSLVAAAARRFGIESSISKKRRQIIAAKTLANRR